jgi:hypothetical protein
MKKKGGILILIIGLAILAGLVVSGIVYCEYFRKDKVNVNLPKIYGDSVVGFKFNYPGKTVIQDVNAGMEKTMDSVTVFKMPINEGTNLKERWLKLTVFNDLCEKVAKAPKNKAEFGDLNFYKYENEEQTNSAKYETREYSLDKNGRCLNFEFGLRSNIVVRGQGTPVFDREKEIGLFGEIMKTVRLIK